jgi:hypothetical protein
MTDGALAMRPQLAQSHSPSSRNRHRALDHIFARRLSGSESHNSSTPQPEHPSQQGGPLTKSGVPVVLCIPDLHGGGEGAKACNITGRKKKTLIMSIMVAEEVT